jgi:hypothetical protein
MTPAEKTERAAEAGRQAAEQTDCTLRAEFAASFANIAALRGLLHPGKPPVARLPRLRLIRGGKVEA